MRTIELVKNRMNINHVVSDVRYRENFEQRVDKSAGCWVFIGSVDSAGYGLVRIKRRLKKAHRYSWEISFGKIPEGRLVLHRCDNPPCVRPDHLWLGSHADNSRDRDAKKRNKNSIAYFSSLKTHCPRGHRLSGNNLQPSALKRGARSCRICRNMQARNYRNK